MTRTSVALIAIATLVVVSACASDSSQAEVATRDATSSTTRMHMEPGTTHVEGMDHEEGLETDGHESDVMYDDLPAKAKAEVDQLMAAYARKYPTGADAAKDGWYRATPSLYGIGAHYTHGIGFPATPTFDLLNPNMLLFDGDGPDAKFAGVSYSVSSATSPEAFTGPHDAWHGHSTVCLKGRDVVSLIAEDSDVWLSESDCTARGGRVMPIPGDLMIHVWIGPGYFDTAPIFAHDHPKLYDGLLPQRDVQV